MLIETVPKRESGATSIARRSTLAALGVTISCTCLVVVACGLCVVRPSDADDKKTTPEAPKAATVSSTDPAKRGAIGVFLHESEDHVLVVRVAPKSPAEKAGLQLGDEIRYFNNERIHTVQVLMDEISASHPGTKMEFVIRRAGQRMVVPIEITSFAALYPDQPVQTVVPAAVNVAKESPSGTQTTMAPETARRMRVLEQQIARLQKEMEALKSTPYVPKPAPPARSFDVNSWIEQHRRGENSGDPSLFQ